jgi:hypothetical protein
MLYAQRVVTFLEDIMAMKPTGNDDNNNFDENIILSAKSYSVLLKGYGRQTNHGMIDVVLNKCYIYSIKPDVVMLNSAMDAYIECNLPEKAIQLLKIVASSSSSSSSSGGSSSASPYRLFAGSNIQPNTRTFNTLLKAFRGGRADSIDRANSAIQYMQELGLKVFTV